MKIEPTVMVPSTLALRAKAFAKITNFDSFTDYVIQAEGIKFTQEDEKITIEAERVGKAALIVNGKQYNIQVFKRK